LQAILRFGNMNLYYMATKRKTRISALLPSLLTDELRRASKEQSIPQGKILEGALRDWLRKKLTADAKKIAQVHFDDLPTEDEWLAIQSKIE